MNTNNKSEREILMDQQVKYVANEMKKTEQVDNLLMNRLLHELISAGTFSIATLALYGLTDDASLDPTDVMLNAGAILSGLVASSKIYLVAEAGLKKLKLHYKMKFLEEQLREISFTSSLNEDVQEPLFEDIAEEKEAKPKIKLFAGIKNRAFAQK